MQHVVALITHRGKVRPDNQDAIAVDELLFTGSMRTPWSDELAADRHVVMLADGIGGQPNGALASRSTLRFLAARLDGCDDEGACEEALHAANGHLYELMRSPETAGMGTTVAGVMLRRGAVLWFSVGDSRVYRFGDRVLVRLGRDDVGGADSSEPGRRSHRLTQAIGGSVFPLGIVPHVGTMPPLRPGEAVLLCSDGLTDVIDDDAIASALAGGGPVRVVETLVRQVARRGAPDNLSVLVVQMMAADDPVARAAAVDRGRPLI